MLATRFTALFVRPGPAGLVKLQAQPSRLCHHAPLWCAPTAFLNPPSVPPWCAAGAGVVRGAEARAKAVLPLCL